MYIDNIQHMSMVVLGIFWYIFSVLFNLLDFKLQNSVYSIYRIKISAYSIVKLQFYTDFR